MPSVYDIPDLLPIKGFVQKEPVAGDHKAVFFDGSVLRIQLPGSGTSNVAALVVETDRGTDMMVLDRDGSVVFSAELGLLDDKLLQIGTDGDNVLVNRSTALLANTALTGVLAGTPVVAAIPANSLIISNITANADLVLATLLGGTNSAEVFRVDTSAGLVVFNEPGSDWDFRIESAATPNMFSVDAGVNGNVGAIGIGVAAVADLFVNVSHPAVSATATVSWATFKVTAGGAVTVPTGTTAVVASAWFTEPNITATGTVTVAATVYIQNAPTEGGANHALYVAAGTSYFGGNIYNVGGKTYYGTSSALRTNAGSPAALELVKYTEDAYYPFRASELYLSQAATAGGLTILTLAPANHTALTAEKLDISLADHSVTLTDGTTIALARSVSLGATTYVGAAGGGTETVTTAVGLEVGLPVQGANATVTNAPIAVRALGNVVIGNILTPAAGPTNTLFVANGTAPTGTVAGSVAFYSSDDAAGHTIPSFYCQGTNVLAEGQADSASSKRVKVRINGTVVTLLGI